MKTPPNVPPLAALVAAALFLASAAADPPPDRTSNFEVDTESWRATDPSVTLAWQATGGASGAYLSALGTGTVWHLASPAAWAGDWSAYRSLKFDLAIPSRHYADNDSGAIVTIVGANSQSISWNGPTPLWTWTHFEISLDPASFATDQATFDAIMSDVVEVRILAEFTATANETIGLDNVLLTTAPVTVYTQDLVARFTNGVKVGTELDGWRPVDDVTLSSSNDGRPLRCLYCDDWQDGRYFKVASPVAWAGDWSGFTELRFDIKWTSTGNIAGTELVRIFGANGVELTWGTSLVKNTWQRIVVPLQAATFGVDEATFQDVMRYVNQLRIRGEYDSGNDQLWLDNIVVATGPEMPRVFSNNLLSRFGTDAEGWIAFDGATLAWSATGGFSGGTIRCTDTGGGTARFCSPDSWSGDWRSFRSLRFMIRPQSAASGSSTVQVFGFNGTTLAFSPADAYGTWCPFTLDLTPAAFGVTQAVFDGVMQNVAHVAITGDLLPSNDTTSLDDVGLSMETTSGQAPPERSSSFATDHENWRKGGEASGVWGLLAGNPEFLATEGNPAGSIAVTDEYSTYTYWFTPEAWCGDWRGHEAVSFDLKILSGTTMLPAGTMLAVISLRGILTQPVATAPARGTWNHYEFPLTATAFGVSQSQFDLVMRDVVMLAVRAEWINGGEKEALDNFRLSKAPEAYWFWLAGYLTPEQLADELLAAKTSDPDGDRHNNWDEFLALTIPTDPADRFTTNGHRPESGGFLVEYLARTGRVYQVWKTSDPAIGWTAVGPLVPGDGSIKTHLDPATGPAAFFRVGVSLP